jgi:hypothetical protein
VRHAGAAGSKRRAPDFLRASVMNAKNDFLVSKIGFEEAALADELIAED